MRTGTGRKFSDVTQGGLIISTLVVTLTQVRDGQVEIMGGEKSEQGIVVIKLVGKVVMASDCSYN